MTHNPMDLSGKNIIVTGASSGIGLATSRMICDLGGTVAMVSRNEAKLNEAQKGMPVGASRAFAFDLYEIMQIPDFVAFVREELGPIAGLVHAAGDFAVTPLRAFDPTEYRRLYDLHVTTFFSLSQAVCSKRNIDSSGASIIAVSSILALVGKEGAGPYSSVKGALISAIRSLAIEHAAKHIRFNSVSPGWVKTPMLESIKRFYPNQDSFDSAVTNKHPLGLGEPEDVAKSICFLLSDAARWTTGANLVLDGGYSAR